MSLPSSLQNLRLPVVAAPMFLVSGVGLVIETCKQGVVGTFPALNQRTTEGFAQWVDEIQAALAAHNATNPQQPAAPFGVNLIVHKSNDRVEADLKVIVEKKVPIVITSLGAAKEVIDAVHSYGGIVFHDVTNRFHAHKAAQAGVDGLILVSGGAGGHAGTINPFALMNDIRPFFSGTILLAGAISTGADVLAARAMGADLAYMGTRFIATQESDAQDEYKQMTVDVGPEDIFYTPAVSGIPASFMMSSLKANGYTDEVLRQAADPSQLAAKISVNSEAKAWKTVWSAGQGVSSIRDIPTVSELVDRLEVEYDLAKRRLER